MRIGASCVGREGFLNKDCKVAEIRFLRGNFYAGYDSHPRAEEALKFCKENDIYVIASLDFYQEGQEAWQPDESTYRQTIEALVQKLFRLGFDRWQAEISGENEPMKTKTKEKAVWYQNLLYSQVKGRYTVGGGNEEFALAAAKGDFYNYFCTNARYDKINIHIQSSCNTESNLAHWENFAAELKRKYAKPIDCTEANWMDVATPDGYQMLLKQLEAAERLGCGNFPIVFIDLKDSPSYRWLSFFYNDIKRSDFYDDFKRIIQEKAEEGETMKLEKYYYRGKVTYNRDPKKAGVKFIQTVTGATPDGKWGEQTDEMVKKYQEDNGLTVDKIVGPNTFREMMKTNEQAYIDLQYFTATGEW